MKHENRGLDDKVITHAYVGYRRGSVVLVGTLTSSMASYVIKGEARTTRSWMFLADREILSKVSSMSWSVRYGWYQYLSNGTVPRLSTTLVPY